MAGIYGAALFGAAPAEQSHPGAEPFPPTRIDWLTTTLEANLRTEFVSDLHFVLHVTSPDSETIVIYVRYLPDVDRESMNLFIESAHKVIQITAKSYGWDSWLKVKEDIQAGGSRK